jgi:hypothetical protein
VREKSALSLTRVQCGVRIEKRTLKVLKALAEYHEVSLGELFEVIVLASFEGAPAFSKGTLKRIAELKSVYELDRTAEEAMHVLFVRDRGGRMVSGAGRRRRSR